MKPISKLTLLRLLLFLIFGVAFTGCIISIRMQSKTQADVEAASKRARAARDAALDVDQRISIALKQQTALISAALSSTTLPSAASQGAFGSSQTDINRLLAEQTRLISEYTRSTADYIQATTRNSAALTRGSILEWLVQPAIGGLIAVGIIERRAKKRREFRLKNNQCVNCGYDLRASAGRCSECGTEISLPARPAAKTSLL